MPDEVTRPITLLDPRKFRDPLVTAKGEPRAQVALRALETLWINTGTLCNLTCDHCYIESSPTNDRLEYITAAEVAGYLDEIQRDRLRTRVIGFTGGEPFMNPGLLPMLEDALRRGFEVLVLTNAMKPMAKCKAGLLALRTRFDAQLTIRVSVDHYGQAVHEAERGQRSWKPTLDGLGWLVANGFRVDVATRRLSGESEAEMRAGFAALFATHRIPIDASDPVRLVVFPEMDARIDVPEITEACWGILHKSPDDVMCSSSRMVVKRKGASAPAVLACTLLPYDRQFELGRTLAEASRPVRLNHPHCAKFCVLGGAACSR
jgi:pyruvate-formate lyase-activating enzyme